MVIFILAAVWAVVLLPPWLRRRREGDPTDSIMSFRRQLSTLGRTAPAWTAYGPSASARRALASAQRRRRRREVLSRLAVATGFTLVMAVVLQGLAIALFAVASALLVLVPRTVDPCRAPAARTARGCDTCPRPSPLSPNYFSAAPLRSNGRRSAGAGVGVTDANDPVLWGGPGR